MRLHETPWDSQNLQSIRFSVPIPAVLSDGFGTGLALNSARVWRVWELQLYRFVALSVIYLIYNNKYIYISYKFYHIHSDSIFYFVFYWSCISYVIIFILVIFTISSLFIFGYRCVFAKLPMAVYDNYDKWQALIKCMELIMFWFSLDFRGPATAETFGHVFGILRHPSASFGFQGVPRCSKAHHVGHMGSHWRKKRSPRKLSWNKIWVMISTTTS